MRKILVVDDEADMRFMVRKILESEGFEVQEAEDGKAALEKLKNFIPDLILLDVMMPGLDGWEVCKRIRDNEETKSVIVTMLTVKSSDEDKVISFDDALADWHISKPFKKKRFIQTINWLLESPLQKG